MRSMLGVASILLLVLALASCDTTQPLQLDQQTLELQILATGAQTREFVVYDGFEDSNLDGQPDDTDGDGQPDFFLHCLTRMTNPQPPTLPMPETGNPNSVPWNYTVSITILRAGETVPERITSTGSGEDPLFSVTEYDSASIFGSVQALPPVAIFDPMTTTLRTFRFQNGRLFSEARREIMAATTSPLVELDPATYGAKGQGRCSTFDPGPSIIDSGTSSAYPRQIILRKGDTVTIEALASPTATPGLTVLNPPQPALAASLKLQGSELLVRGATNETTPGGGLRFSYTSR